jgi:hypothetical protein
VVEQARQSLGVVHRHLAAERLDAIRL